MAKKRWHVMTLQYQPALTHSVWVDTYLGDKNDCVLPHDELVARLRQGVRDGEWIGWRLMHIDTEVLGNA